jgi:hypothetical protein
LLLAPALLLGLHTLVRSRLAWQLNLWHLQLLIEAREC